MKNVNVYLFQEYEYTRKVYSTQKVSKGKTPQKVATGETETKVKKIQLLKNTFDIEVAKVNPAKLAQTFII
jgi:hypothetical protein